MVLLPGQTAPGGLKVQSGQLVQQHKVVIQGGIQTPVSGPPAKKQKTAGLKIIKSKISLRMSLFSSNLRNQFFQYSETSVSRF